MRVGLNYKLNSKSVVVPGYGSRIYKAPIAAIWTWTGLYLGINAGYGFGKSQTEDHFSDAGMGTPLFATGSSSRLDGLIAGTEVGYNWQAGGWLFGIEADIQATNQHAGPTYVCRARSAIPLSPMSIRRSRLPDYKLDWFATVRGRVGAAITPDAVIYMRLGA